MLADQRWNKESRGRVGRGVVEWGGERDGRRRVEWRGVLTSNKATKQQGNEWRTKV